MKLVCARAVICDDMLPSISSVERKGLRSLDFLPPMLRRDAEPWSLEPSMLDLSLSLNTTRSFRGAPQHHRQGSIVPQASTFPAHAADRSSISFSASAA